jgi:uncharacterized membrane protein YgcG
MPALLFPLHGALLIIHLVVFVVVLGALIDAVIRPDRAFVAAGKQTKVFWCLILLVGVFIALVGIIAAIVYFVDVRPALREIGGGGGGRGRGSSSDGPYGPYRR